MCNVFVLECPSWGCAKTRALYSFIPKSWAEMECNQRKLALSSLPPAAQSRVIKLIEHCDDSTIVPLRMDLILLLDSYLFIQLHKVTKRKSTNVNLNILWSISHFVYFSFRNNLCYYGHNNEETARKGLSWHPVLIQTLNRFDLVQKS